MNFIVTLVLFAFQVPLCSAGGLLFRWWACLTGMDPELREPNSLIMDSKHTCPLLFGETLVLSAKTIHYRSPWKGGLEQILPVPCKMCNIAGIRGQFSPNSPVKCLSTFAPQSSKSSTEENCMGAAEEWFFPDTGKARDEGARATLQCPAISTRRAWCFILLFGSSKIFGFWLRFH